MSWEQGIVSAYKENVDDVFIAPPVSGWTLVVGWWAAGEGDRRSVRTVEKIVVNLSSRFSEAQGFATHRIVEYHHWILARDGNLVRSFAYVGESGELLANIGSITTAERRLAFWKEPSDRWSPSENDVMTVAGDGASIPRNSQRDQARLSLACLAE